MKQWLKDQWYYNDVEWSLGIVIAVIIGAVILAIAHDVDKAQAERAVFFAACTEDHKQYECEVLWGQAHAGDSHTAVVPMPIIIPSGR